MQTVSCHVAFPGVSVDKTDVTPTELAILRSLHGDDAITEVTPTADIERTDVEEFTRLVKIYGPNAPVALVESFDVPEPEPEAEATAEPAHTPAPKKPSRKK